MKVVANFFYVPGHVELRGIVGEHGILHVKFPTTIKPPSAAKVLDILIKKLKAKMVQQVSRKLGSVPLRPLRKRCAKCSA